MGELPLARDEILKEIIATHIGNSFFIIYSSVVSFQ